MTKVALGIAAGLLACTGILSAADISGEWSGLLGGPAFITLKQDGTKLTGSMGSSPKERTLFFEDGKVEGDHVTFRAGTVRLDLRIRGDEIAGEANTGSEVVTVVLRRVTADGDQKALRFEVASIKRHKAEPGPGTSSMTVTGGRMTCSNVSLRKLIVNGFGVKDYQVSGPDWMGTESYDIVATLPAESRGDQLLPMVQNLLADRFHLQYHRETKEMPVYAVVVAKGGIKMTPVEFGRGSTSSSSGHMDATRIPIQKLAEFLAQRLDRPVLDMTDVKGFFDFKLDWAPDEKNTDNLPDLMTAVQQQLGLKLEARRAPVEILVVDGAEKTPTEN